MPDRLPHAGAASARKRPALRVVADPVSEAVTEFSLKVYEKWDRGGSAEDQLRGPVEGLFQRLAEHIGVKAIPYGEVRLKDIKARPDYAVDVGGSARGAVRAGYIELKAPDRQVPPLWRPNKHEKTQHEKLSALPNVLYTNGMTWSRLSFGEVRESVTLIGDPTSARKPLQVQSSAFIALISNFLLWQPESPRSLAEVIRMSAGLCRLLREEVLAVLAVPNESSAYEDLYLLADDWRDLLFPDLNDMGFADAYAQTVTFALLLAGLTDIALPKLTLHEVARQLGKKHSLMGRALSVLTDSEAAEQLRTVDTLQRVVGAIDWKSLSHPRDELYSDLYEGFLATYDPDRRRESGSYYTPQDVARSMVRFAHSIIREKLEKPWGLASKDVVVVDPAMGTGTFLVEVVRTIAETIEGTQGPGARPARLRELFRDRLVGFENQAGPYAVAELRLHETLKTEFNTEVPLAECRFLTDALEDPREQQRHFGAAYRVIGKSREEANRIKREVPVMVVIGNPPHVGDTKGRAPWVEKRRRAPHIPGHFVSRPSLDEFRGGGASRYDSDLYGLPWCFWRWAIWKAFEAHPESPSGVVAFLTPSSFIKGRSFAGMREYLRRICDYGWVINLSPEGNRPPQSSRIFGPKVGRELCIAVFARHGASETGTPATVLARSLVGSRSEKLDELMSMTLETEGWEECQNGWRAPFLSTGSREWREYPALGEMMPWTSRGVTAGRTWVCAPDIPTLRRRWDQFLRADTQERRILFHESDDFTLDKVTRPLPGFRECPSPLTRESAPMTEPVQIAFRSFDRQWIIPDSRLITRPRPSLWTVRSDSQIYVTEQSNDPIKSGPGLTFTDLIPDIHHYNARSGRILPLYRDADGVVPNFAPGLLDTVAECLGLRAAAPDMLAYIAAIVAHGGYTKTFASELTHPGVHVPLTSEPRLWLQAVEIGRRVLWLHSYGNRFVSPDEGRPRGIDRLVERTGPRVVEPISDLAHMMPEEIEYDENTQLVRIGTGAIGPVSQDVIDYNVAGMAVVRHWFDYRSRHPKHKKRSSPLDDRNCRNWTVDMTDELLRLLTTLDQLIALERQQNEIMQRVVDGPLILRSDLVSKRVIPAPSEAGRPLRVLPDDALRLF